MNGQPSLVHRATHRAKLLVHRAGFDVTRDTFKYRFVHQVREHGIDAVLDIGANTGQFAVLMRQSGFTGRIHSVEPLQSAYAQLQAAAGRDPRWTVERAAVGAEAGTLTMNVSGNSVSSSVLQMLERHATAAPSAQYVAQEEVPATTVDDIVRAQDLDPERTLLKIDVQGYEKAVLDGAAKTLPALRAVRTEMSLVPLYEGQVLMPEVVAELGALGLDLWFIEPGFAEPDTRRLLQLDGMFFRSQTR